MMSRCMTRASCMCRIASLICTKYLQICGSCSEVFASCDAAREAEVRGRVRGKG